MVVLLFYLLLLVCSYSYIHHRNEHDRIPWSSPTLPGFHTFFGAANLPYCYLLASLCWLTHSKMGQPQKKDDQRISPSLAAHGGHFVELLPPPGDHWGITLMCLLQNNKELLIIWHCLLEWSHRMVHSPKPKGYMFPLQCSTQEMLWFLKGKPKEDIDGIVVNPLQL